MLSSTIPGITTSVWLSMYRFVTFSVPKTHPRLDLLALLQPILPKKKLERVAWPKVYLVPHMKLFTVLALAEGPSKLAPDLALGLQSLGLLVGREDTSVSCCSVFITCQAGNPRKYATELGSVSLRDLDAGDPQDGPEPKASRKSPVARVG